MKSLLLLALLAFPAISYAQFDPSGMGWTAISPKKWGGLNLLNDSTMIDGDAQDAVNVLTDSGYLEKRPGNTRLATILAGSPVLYANDWSAPNGNRYLIAQASSTIYQTNFSGAPVALSTISVGFNLTTVPAFSKLEFADGFRSLWYWDGNSTATVTDVASGAIAPVCTYISFKDNRIWCANLPNGFTTTGNTTNGGGSSTVLISSSGGDGYFAVPSNVATVDNAPNRFDFNPNDGDQITCLYSTPFGMFVGKRNSSYIVKGNGNLTYDPRLLDPKIGCVDNRSLQMVYGVLEWLAVDGVYWYDGTGPPRLLSRKLDPIILLARESSFSQGQWATQLQSDWATGIESTTTFSLPPLPWDYTTTPSQIFPSSFTLYDDNRSPPLQGGVGFSSDTLINIDTVTSPLSIGNARLALGDGLNRGVYIWASSFTDGGYSSFWTSASGSMANQIISFSTYIYSTSGTSEIYTRASSQTTFGYWSFDWLYTDSAAFPDHACTQSSPAVCFLFKFQEDSSGNYYALKMTGGIPNAFSITKHTISGDTDLAVSSETAGLYFPKNANIHINVKKDTAGRMFASASSTFNVTGSNPVVLTLQAQDTSITSIDKTRISLLQDSFVGLTSINNATNFYFGQYASSGSIISRIMNTGQGNPLAGVLASTYTLQGTTGQTELDFFVRSSTSPNNDLWSSWSASSNNVLAVLPRRYWQYEANFYTNVASYTPTLTSVSLPAVTTGYYYSKINFVGNLITSWRQFGVTETNPGTYGYAVREATYAFSQSDTSIAWIAQTANQNVNLAVSTPTYAQFRLDSTSLVSNLRGASAAEPVSAIFLRWNQGANLPVASNTLERRYYLCVAISTNATAPDTCFVRQKTGDWVEWTGPTVGAMGLYNNQMVAADGGNTSYIWQIMQPNVYEDDGAAINAYWVSSDFTGGLTFNDKIYHEAWVDALPIQGSTVTYSYQINKSSGFVNQPFSLDSGQPLDISMPVIGSQFGDINKWLQPVVGYDTGKYIRAEFSNNTLDQYFRINDYLIYIEPQVRTTP